jgi:hypothetical protein
VADRRERSHRVGRGRPALERAGERERGGGVFIGGGKTPVKRCWEGDDRDDGRRRQIRPQREREREREREGWREGPPERERGCWRRFRWRRRTPVKQCRQGDDPTTDCTEEKFQRERGGAALEEE